MLIYLYKYKDIIRNINGIYLDGITDVDDKSIGKGLERDPHVVLKDLKANTTVSALLKNSEGTSIRMWTES